MTNKWIYGLIVFILMVTAASVAAQTDRRSIAVVLETPKQHIPDFSLVDRLNDALSMYAGLKVLIPYEDDSRPQPPDNRFDLESLIDWGKEMGVRYIIYLQVDKRLIATAKRWSIPLILSRYVVEGHLDGAYSLIDTRHQKRINVWNLEAELAGPQQWQIAEDYRDDPDLHIPAPQKMSFLQKLDDLAAAQIIRNIAPNLKGR